MMIGIAIPGVEWLARQIAYAAGRMTESDWDDDLESDENWRELWIEEERERYRVAAREIITRAAASEINQ